ncbi:MAG: hypothetical protein JJU05_14130 [Verrucomicrobia bacterium]|nr:hypothetical protein [Verrucomicrobiota bacterium]MCH8526576.1 hypothetical protein [Kiritimatiellia bacterium]
MATKTLQIKKKKRVVLAPKSIKAVHQDSEEIEVPDDAFVSQSVEDALEAKSQPNPILPQGLQTSHFFDAYLAESQKLKQTASNQEEANAVSEAQAPETPPTREVLGAPTFKFFCYRCGQKLQVPVAWANKMHTCKSCGYEIVIPPPLMGDSW